MNAAHAVLRDRPARVVFLTACVVFLAVTAWIFARSIVLAPYSDQIDLLARYLDYRNHGDLAAYLFAPHNFHRLSMLMGLIALDASAHADGWILVVAGAISLAGAAAIVAGAAAASTPGVSTPGAALAAMLVLAPGNLLNAAIHLNTHYVHCLFLSFAALTLAERGQRDAPWPRRFGALACAVGAGFSSAAGLALWPVLVLGALRNREAWPWLAALLATGGALTGFYVTGGATGGAELDLLGAGRYALALLGLPWGRLSPVFSWVIGALVLVGAAAALLLQGGPDRPRAERLATRYILYALVVIAMISVGRTGLAEASDPPVRYATFLAPLHVGFLMLTLPYIGRLRGSSQVLALALAAVLLVGQQAVMGLAAVRTTDVNRKLIADFRQGLRYPAMIPTIHHDLDHAAAAYGRLDAAGLTRRPAPPARLER